MSISVSTRTKLLILLFFVMLVLQTNFVFATESQKQIDSIKSPTMTGGSSGVFASSYSAPRPTPIVNPLSLSPAAANPGGSHWWITEFWDTPGGGSLPSRLTGEFVAQANTFVGLQAGPLYDPWYDAVLYLPLNVAYGTSTTNCVWFQFDIQFVKLGLPQPFYPHDIEWFIWDIQGPATPNDRNLYTSTPIGIPYIVGHRYWFSLTPSGTNTITFYINDETIGQSWSLSTWHHPIPGINIFADEGMFSPASCVEGYTTSTTLSGIPFFQTLIGEGVTWHRPKPITTDPTYPLPPPTGIATTQMQIELFNKWYWMMLATNSSPYPLLNSIPPIPSIKLGECATIDVSASNLGGDASWQTIAISFPVGESLSRPTIVGSDFPSGSYGVHDPGEPVNAVYGTASLNLQNYLVEGSTQWPKNAQHYLRISVTPSSIGSFKFYVKSVAAAREWACNWDPQYSTDTDQQHEYVYTYSISVGVNPSSISIGINPSQVDFGGGTTISGTISSSFAGDLSGTVYLQYSPDGSSWNPIGNTQSGSSGYYAYWWTPPSVGTFYVRSYWNGNSNYGGATSSSVTLTVRSTGGSLTDHAMCKGVQPTQPFSPVTRTNTFYTDDDGAYSWVEFSNIYSPTHIIHFDWYDPDGAKVGWMDWHVPDPGAGNHYALYGAFMEFYINGNQAWFASRIGRPFQTKVYFDGNLAVTETWQVIKHSSSISLSLSSNTINYGQSVTVSSQLSSSFSDGTTTLQYSTDGANWNVIASGTPSSGSYSNTWSLPNTANYYVLALWTGDLNYYGSTSSSQTLTVNRAPTSLTTSPSSTTIAYGSATTITTSMSPALQGKPVTIEYSPDESTWFYLNSGITNPGGHYSYSWAPAAGIYYLHSTWSGDVNYVGSTSPIQQLTVNQASTFTVCSLSTGSINYGESATVTGTVSASVSDGTMILEYSSDGMNWNIISSGTPSSGSYSYAWIPTNCGTFSIRATWSGSNNYQGSTSSTQTLTVAGARAFDFGTSSSPVELGFVQVTEATAYSGALGHGWSATSGLYSRDRGAPDNLRRDLVCSTGDHTFLVDLPNGEYSVTLIIGDYSYTHDLIDVYAEGELKLDDLTVTSGSFQEWSFTITVADSQLNLLFHDGGGTDGNWIINAITIGPPPPPCHVHLESVEDTGTTSNLGSTIFDGVAYTLPNDISKPAVTYVVSYMADGYVLDHWETSGGVTILGSMVTVEGDGTLRVVYKAAPSGWKFDFGTASSPVESGYVKVTESTAYSAGTGYGWDSTVGLGSRDRSVPDNLRRDFVFSGTDHTFNVDLANGQYKVTLTIGDNSYTHDLIDVYAENVLLVNHLTASGGSFSTQSFIVTVSDGQLNIRFHDAGGSDLNWVINAIKIEPFVSIAQMFDFGTAGSPVASGFVQVTDSTVYSGALGYGWDSTVGLTSRDRGAPDDLRRDLVCSTSDHTFNVDLANGQYKVTLVIGDQSYGHDLIDVSAEGVLQVNHLTVSAGTFSTQVFTVTVNDGQLNLKFHDAGGSDDNWVINAIKIEPTV